MILLFLSFTDCVGLVPLVTYLNTSHAFLTLAKQVALLMCKSNQVIFRYMHQTVSLSDI